MHVLQVESLNFRSAACRFGVTSNDRPSSMIFTRLGGMTLAPAIRQSSVSLLEVLVTSNQLACDSGVDIAVW